ncbi:hypothetical protein [Phytohabitans kaempferiae]|uniref:SnoaL-like domain-containing protein n=1 Tax=Phytohabitans kaempferiae TaxID=1620943 RepID=A0ABV6MGE0_9ACTN
MRSAYAHEAVLVMAPDADLGAPGAAITVALCGHWEHQPPCPLAAHHTRAEPASDEVRVRVLFATEPASESLVRQRIDLALAGGEFRGPDGLVTRWRLRTSQPSDITAAEIDHAERLTHT